MLRFWQTIDLLGVPGAPRVSWQDALGDGFEAWQPLLRACDTVASMLDPEFPGEVLDLEETHTGDFLGFSRAIPSHRPPLAVKRDHCVRLVPNLRTIAQFVGQKLGFTPETSPRKSAFGFHEIGCYTSEKDDPRSVHLFIPDSRDRQSALQSGIVGAKTGIVLLPTSAGFTHEVGRMAADLDVHVRVLATAGGLDRLSTAPPKRSGRLSGKPTRAPIFTPKEDWQWKELTLTIERDGLRFQIRGEHSFQPWAALKLKPIMAGRQNETLKLLGHLANGRRITQRRSDVTARQQVSVARKFLQELIPIRDNPFRKFSDGWGIEFRVDGATARKQVAQWEADDEPEDFSPDRQTSAIDPEDMAGYSIHKF